jgi:hypothetical protein
LMMLMTFPPGPPGPPGPERGPRSLRGRAVMLPMSTLR